MIMIEAHVVNSQSVLHRLLYVRTDCLCLILILRMRVWRGLGADRMRDPINHTHRRS